MLADISIGLTKAQAFSAPKIFQLNRSLGEREVVKLLVVVLRAFVDSLRVKEKPDAADLIALADDLARTYTHDSLKDIILALKEARTNGTNFFQALDVSTLYRLIAEYFDRKAQYLEHRHLDQKATGASLQAQDVRLLGDSAPRLLEHVAQQIPADHPNADALRYKLTITKARETRGLITPEQAAEQRAETRQATLRKTRPDWQPTPEAQAQIAHRHLQEEQTLLHRYRTPNP
ncbi:hypothetical protein Q3A66_07180 [Hymenobacter sp. BT770]|uniref:hypothetical protein n=1 Tax=Hymenobacter sp. BT770 TaxID=2886942 RepID=UPI001D0F93FE|nr:hypothetical protein [Hymenobacter sp. BT770]MCC3152772.1 hypothetical protein [Hymenobacter sp. BT770]MDO3414847.1 hypothetical protein [Hymenobacter sp. BT770]